MDLPFSLSGNKTYEKASKECDTLPNMVEQNKFIELLPQHIQNIIGIKFDSNCEAISNTESER